ncbi:MAG: shikimate dehydrogenase [Deltaproteobacteria bacterium]|nr:shikimate dehydrogenase [Deltaproteobacteria bacterium]
MPPNRSTSTIMICIPITATNTQDALRDMQAAAPLADLLELRLDYIENPDLPLLLANRPTPVIITITPREENGRFAGTDAERLTLLEQAITLGAEYIDCNLGWQALPRLQSIKGKTRIIVSSHNYAETPADLSAIYREIAATGADVVKIASFANRISDNLRMLDLIRAADRDCIGICMGEKGEVSRILAPAFGALLTFASLGAGKESAPGQIPAETMRSVYNLSRLQAGTQLFGLIGNPVSKSRGYILFNRLFQHYGLNMLYLNFLTDDMDDFMGSFGRLLSGFSITMPHKQVVMPYLDETDQMSTKIGAINTVLNRDGRLTGCNTDAAGVVQPLLKRTELQGKRVTLLGAGGAARAAAVALINEGARVTMLNRTVSRATELARELGCTAGALNNLNPDGTDVLVNMTSVGMHPNVDETPVPAEKLHDMIVFDGVYNPPVTLLLRSAAQNGCRVIPGIEMFISQAAEQFRLWTGIAPDLQLMEDILS